MFESWFQASLQLISMVEYGAFDGDGMSNKASRIFSLAISFASILYGLSTHNLRMILKDEPNIMKTFLFTITELTTTIALFLYILVPYSIFWALMDDNTSVYLKILGFVLLYGIPTLGALFSSKLELDNCFFSVDYRINISLKCKQFCSLTEMVRIRKRLVIVNLIYLLLTAIVVILAWLYQTPICIIPPFTCIKELSTEQFRSMVLILCWSSACLLSFLENYVELVFILVEKKSFLDWAFKEGLEEQRILERLKEIRLELNAN